MTLKTTDWQTDIRQMKNEIENWPNDQWSAETMLYWVVRAEAAETEVGQLKRERTR